jgi:quercetin dioxygenase-like cupin family protein
MARRVLRRAGVPGMVAPVTLDRHAMMTSMRDAAARRLAVVLLVSLAMHGGCQSPASLEARQEPGHGAMAAASGVTRADAGKGPTEHRIIPLRPMTGDVELLYGDPDVAGQPFVMRIHELPGARVPPHSHPVDEHITVVQGTWYFAVGSDVRQESLQELKAGSYAFAPKGSTMSGYSPDGAIVQVHGVGPFHIHWKGGLRTLDAPDWEKTFRFTKGAEVIAGERRGRILQGYASGAIAQYEIKDAAGQRFMADEGAVRRP